MFHVMSQRQLLTTSMGGLSYVTMGTWEKDISFGYTVILLAKPPTTDTNIQQPANANAFITINRIEKACMFPWFQVFSLLIFLRLLSVLDHVIYVLPDRLACAR